MNTRASPSSGVFPGLPKESCLGHRHRAWGSPWLVLVVGTGVTRLRRRFKGDKLHLASPVGDS